MVAKIGRGNHLMGVLIYNHEKIEKDQGNIVHSHKMIHPSAGAFTIPLLERSFEPYLIANNRTEKPILHISLNPNPNDIVSDERFSELADNYMQEMGYGEQPYVVFKHTDTGRAHIHIVSVCVDEYGKRISDSFEKVRSMNVCRKLEKKFKLTSAIDSIEQKDVPLQKVDNKQDNVKRQITSVLRFANENYKFQTLGEYKALLSFFNITAQEVRGIIHGKEKRGLVYFATNDVGEKVSNPFKSSRFTLPVGLADLERKFKKSKTFIDTKKPQKQLRKLVRDGIQKYPDQDRFRKYLQDNKISMFVRKNDEGRIYGISFIDHTSKTVLNGSRLGKDLSANVFHRLWNEEKEITSTANAKKPITQHVEYVENELTAEAMPLFNAGVMESLGGLLPTDVPEENDMKKVKKKRKNRKDAKRR
ncbi:conjugal transfer protein MobB [Tenacibaculum jejuense]|uniref:Relaxase/mobilization nuclease domain protein n=1 Tax=Tenacibaculum jejuense TaxID=584609 RepID=A0A238U5F7_9FLAO|nr:conjugal transfer protein MobB [Tenacibaculum jejuense]SNR14443.1 Relaxase/mobilization nuclease domain protein [Tenacibaculum jejuense]